MFHNLHLVLTCMCVKSFEAKDVFDIRADDMFETMVGDVLEVKKYMNKTDINDIAEDLMFHYNASAVNITQFFKTRNTTNPKSTTAKDVAAGTPFTPRPKQTSESMEKRRRMFQIRSLLDRNINTMPDFKNDPDNPKIQTRRFDSILANPIMESRRQQVYFHYENVTEIFENKKRVLAIMQQFIYTTRYKLPHSQLLREKYKDHIRYKIGFSMALLRVIKMQQKTLYSTLESNLLDMETLYVHLKLYERIVRYDVDIRDLIAFIKQLDRQRKLDNDPNYYDYYH